MIININDIERLRKFVLDTPTDEELRLCNYCTNVKEDTKCKDKDICYKYTPVVGENTMKLIKDLFDTIEYLRKETIS